MNTVSLIGRLVKDANITSANNGQMQVAKFTIAVNRIKKDEADFINCVAFDKTAEIIGKYTTKGSQVGIVGHIQTGSYKTKEGNTVYTTDVIVDRLDLIGSKAESKSEPKFDASVADGEFMKIDDLAEEGLPFK